MREKYESLSLATLKDLAKARGLKGVSALRKPELIERMLHEDELEGETKKQETDPIVVSVKLLLLCYPFPVSIYFIRNYYRK